VQHLKQRVKTAKDLGFEKIVAPEKEADSKVVKNIKDLVKTLFG
jgi:predicted ATP-dependent serine protease